VTVFAGAPAAVDDAYSATAGTPLEVAAGEGLLANDQPSVRGPLAAEIVDQPAHGAIELASDGSFRYTPADGYSGEDSFTYRASDGVQASAAAVALTIAAADDGDEDEQEPGDDDEGGCGCRSAGGSGPLSFFLVLAFLSLGRRFRLRG
jgi:hypothetical protein